MIDFHTHILPGIDDGAKNAAEGLALLEQMRAQGVTLAVATPHFFPGSMAIEDFFQNRDEALGELMRLAGKDYPVKIIPGAEVLYFGGIGGFEGVRRLAAGKSRYLLLELLGVKEIDKKVIKDITNLKDNLGITPVIAHVERYCRYKGYRALVKTIAEGVALCQINAGFFVHPAEKRAVKKLLKRGLVDIIASDCHSPALRPVKLNEGIAELRGISAVQTTAVLKKCAAIKEELAGL